MRGMRWMGTVAVCGVMAGAAMASSQWRITRPVGEMVSILKERPVYPKRARAADDTVDGAVVLAVTIGKDGAPKSVSVTKSLRKDYDRSALKAVWDWRWQPYFVSGRPQEVGTVVVVNYSMR